MTCFEKLPRVVGLFALAMVALVSACSSPDDQAEPTVQNDPPSSVESTSTSTTSTTLPRSGFPDGLGRTETTEATVIDLPNSLIVSDGGSIREIRGDSSLPLARVSPLQPGDDPADGETFGLIDVGGARMVFAEVRTRDQIHIVGIDNAGVRTFFGAGSMPSVDADASIVVFADDRELVVASGAGQVVGTLELGSAPNDLDVSSDGATVAVLLGDEVLTFEVSGSGLAENGRIQVSADSSAVAWAGDDMLGVARRGQNPSVDVVDSSGRILRSVGIGSALVDLDWSADGSAAVGVTDSGQLVWVVGQAWGLIEGPNSEAAIW